uniref:Uncharacterized protein n=1 Tax=Nelumbo nucifera TaxID=4432 RepID=A0A822YK53_NELNU|nr:TPA_asm: hypothetical protein HUJ06_011738 [Nelumbo nucifera]
MIFLLYFSHCMDNKHPPFFSAAIILTLTNSQSSLSLSQTL